jgi:hypothetical protein
MDPADSLGFGMVQNEALGVENRSPDNNEIQVPAQTIHLFLQQLGEMMGLSPHQCPANLGLNSGKKYAGFLSDFVHEDCLHILAKQQNTERQREEGKSDDDDGSLKKDTVVDAICFLQNDNGSGWGEFSYLGLNPDALSHK